MNESVTKLCEICQIKIEQDDISHFLNNDCKLNLLELLPEIDLQLTQNSIICNQCFCQITDVQVFKRLQVKNEDKALQQHVPSINNFKGPDEDLKEAFINDNTICVKEEPGVEKIKEEFNVGLIKDEVCDLQVIKDDFLVNIDNKKELIQHIYKQHKKKVNLKKDLIRKPTSEKIYQCDKCDYKNGHKGRLKMHILSKHTEEKPYQCDWCDYKSAGRYYLKLHILSQHEKPYQCDKCDYKSSYKGHLKIHILSKHTGERLHHCNQCDYKSARRDRLKLHILTHTGEYPFKCDQCDYKSPRRYALKLHKSTHTGEYRFQCDQCDYKTAYKGSLKNHKSTHTGEYPFQCDKCNYKCAYKSSLKNHNLIHNGEIYMCTQCKCSYSSRKSLKIHMTRRHWQDSLPM